MDMSSIADHGVFTWNFIEVPEHHLSNQKIRLVPERTFFLKRFHTGNIMHTIHDDFLGLYFHLKHYANSQNFNQYNYHLDDFEPFNKNHHLVFIDGFDEGGYGHIFKLLTQFPLRFQKDLSNSNEIFYFPDAVVGQSKLVNWYQYGFFIPQGPIANKIVSGFQVREVASFILKSLSLPKWNRDWMLKNLGYLNSIAQYYNFAFRQVLSLPKGIIIKIKVDT